jgi:hypothetical protein
MAVEVVKTTARSSGSRTAGRVRAFFRPTCSCGWRGGRSRDGDEVSIELFRHTGDPMWLEFDDEGAKEDLGLS